MKLSGFCSGLKYELVLYARVGLCKARLKGRSSPLFRCETFMTSPLQSPSLPSAVAAEQTYLQIPSQPEWIAPTVEYLKDKAILCGACHETRVHKLTLVLHEALTNSIIHGNLELSSDLKERGDGAFTEALAERAADPYYASRTVEVHIDYNGERCRWTITDRGKGFDVERALAHAASDDPALMLASGRGILLMRAFLDEVSYEMGGRRAILTLTHPSGAEKRRAPRLPMQQTIRVAPIDDSGVVDWDAVHEAVAQNLSADGIGLLQNRIANSSHVLVGIDWQGQMLYVPAEVRHCRTRGDDAVELGCRFQLSPAAFATNAARNADVERAIDALLEQKSVRADERRLHARAAYTARITIETSADRPPLIGFGRDLSKGGMSFLTSMPLPFDEVTLTLPAHNGEALKVAAHVVRCHQIMSGVYDVGVRFVAVAAPTCHSFAETV